MLLARQPNERLAAVVRTADRIDYWVRRRIHATHLVRSKLWPAEDRPNPPRMSGASYSKLFLAGDQSAWLSIGNCLRAQYDALAAPLPAHIAALVAQLERMNTAPIFVQKPHWLDYDPLALAVLVIGIGIVELLALML
jgi:hypothetical protein